jgi:hypothetical protein
MYHLPQAPENYIGVISNFPENFMAIFASEGASPESTTPVANFANPTASVVDTNSKLPPVSTIPAANTGEK